MVKSSRRRQVTSTIAIVAGVAVAVTTFVVQTWRMPLRRILSLPAEELEIVREYFLSSNLELRLGVVVAVSIGAILTVLILFIRSVLLASTITNYAYQAARLVVWCSAIYLTARAAVFGISLFCGLLTYSALGEMEPGLPADMLAEIEVVNIATFAIFVVFISGLIWLTKNKPTHVSQNINRT